METPNIFRYSRGAELNTAMLGWIIDHAIFDGELKDLSLKVLRLMLKGQVTEIKKLKTVSMYKNIPVVIEVNDDYLLSIEDITFAKNRTSMLKKKREMLLSDEKYKDREMIFVYINVGNKFNLDIKKDGNSVRITRKDILELLSKYLNKGYCLVDEYIAYLNFLENLTNKHREENNFYNWHRLTWEGYFNEIKKGDKDAVWQNVTSQKGDSISLTFNKIEKKYAIDDIEYAVYLNVGTDLPCRYNYLHNESKPYILLKVEVNEGIYKSEIRNYVWQKISKLKEKYEEEGFVIEKTNHAIGTHMTVGKIEEIKNKEKIEEYINNLKLILSDIEKEI